MTRAAEKTLGSSRVAIVGCGMMGEAILTGVLGSGSLPVSALRVSNPDRNIRDAISSNHGVAVFESNLGVLPADVVVLAVKPQVIDSVCEELAGHLDGALVVSIAVGVPCARLESALGGDVAVVRVMPNTPALIGRGVSVVSPGSSVSSDEVRLVCELFDCVGSTIVLDERHQDAAAAISGSGPAYFELIVDALARAGVRHGLPRAVAEELAIATMEGTARLMIETGEHPQALIDRVTSPGGTTIAALETMEALGLRTALAEGVAAAIERAEELR